MAARVAVEVVPVVRPPAEVEQAIADAVRLRDRARGATEAVAAAQANAEAQEHADVEQAAARARAGESLGAPAAALKKARDTLALAQRDLAAIRLAQEQSEQEVAEAIVAQADQWCADLATEVEQAREAGRQAIAALEQACARIAAAESAEMWIASGVVDGRFDRRQVVPLGANIAPSSRALTANAAPLGRDELLGYVSELIEPWPTVQRTPLVAPATA
jgi:hypothetical protein